MNRHIYIFIVACLLFRSRIEMKTKTEEENNNIKQQQEEGKRKQWRK